MKKIISILMSSVIIFLSASSFGYGMEKVDVKSNYEVENVVYKKVESKNLSLDIYFPVQNQKEKTPVVIYFHGGSWVSGDKGDMNKYFSSVVSKLRAQGITVISANYRLFGEKRNYMMENMASDAKDTIKWVRKNAQKYGFDEENISLWGDSAGGHLALLAGMSKDDEFVGDQSLIGVSSKVKSIVAYYPPTDLEMLKKDLKEGKLKGVKGVPKDIEKFSDLNIKFPSPIDYIKGEDIPKILIIHGRKDKLVNIAQSREFLEKSKMLGIQNVKLVEVENGSHGPTSMKNIDNKPSYKDIVDMTEEFVVQSF